MPTSHRLEIVTNLVDEREKYFEECVRTLQTSTLIATEQAERMRHELENLKTLQRSQCVILLEYLHCSFLECADCLNSFTGADENKSPLRSMAVFCSLPLAHQWVSSRLADGDETALDDWHQQVVLPIQRLIDGVMDIEDVVRSLNRVSRASSFLSLVVSSLDRSSIHQSA